LKMINEEASHSTRYLEVRGTTRLHLITPR
jgi:hypothetical protein